MGQRETSEGSLFAAIANGIASQEQSALLQKLEIALGFFGFFTVLALVTTVVATLNGKPAVFEALVAAGFVGITYVFFRRWQYVGRRIAEDAARRGRDLGR